MRVYVICFSLLVFVCSSFPVWSQSGKQSFRAYKWEASARINYTDDLDIVGQQGSSVLVDSDVGFGFTLGYHYNNHLLLNFSFDYNQPDYQARVVSENPVEPDVIVSHGLDQTTAQFNMLYHITTGRLAPYLQAGLGWTYVDSNIAIGPAYGGCWWDPWWGYVCQGFQDTYDDNVFSYNFGGGIRYEFGYGTFVRLGYQNNWMDFDNTGKVDSGVITFEIGSTF